MPEKFEGHKDVVHLGVSVDPDIGREIDQSRWTMSCEAALQVLIDYRTSRQIVITNMMTARIWPTMSQHPLDFNYLSSTMGGAVPLGLGLALARPEYEVVVLSGDGSLLMNLGCLATVVASRVTNLTIVVMDNGLYEVTGGQKTAGRTAPISFSAMAAAAGFAVTKEIRTIDEWRDFRNLQWPSSGPALISLSVQPVLKSTSRFMDTMVDQELQRMQAVLSGHLHS
jgi:thiamine pyrophosphate-dependent acetolactate synthase large subunit-like protein